MAARYPEIKKYILEQIDNGHYKVGVMLPAEKEFTELFGVSRMTIRRAFDDLIQDGVLVRKRGSGVFLVGKKLERSSSRLSISHDEDINKIFDELSVKVIDFKIVHNHYVVRNCLGLENEDAYQVKRVQLGNNVPIVYENIFLPCKYFSTIQKKDCQESMTEIVKKHFNQKKVKKKNKIRVDAKLATKTVSSLLQVPVNSPILQLEIVVTGTHQEKYYCGINSYSGDDFNYYTGDKD